LVDDKLEVESGLLADIARKTLIDLLVRGELQHQPEAALLFSSFFNERFCLLARIVIIMAGVEQRIA